MRGLDGKVAIVAGAAPGNIGAATAVRLAEEDATVVAADLNESAAQSVVDEIRELDGKAVARSVDISDEASYKRLIDFTVKEFGRLDGLFNVAADLSAATVAQDSDVMSVSVDTWRHTIDVTLTGYMYGIRHALPIMIGQGGGAIVNTMSSSVWMGEDRHVAYQAAKAGLYGLTRHTATLGGKHGVRCNSVAPGVYSPDRPWRIQPKSFATKSSHRCGRPAWESRRILLRWWRSCSPMMGLRQRPDNPCRRRCQLLVIRAGDEAG